jgi:DNA-binding MarR family transcriptional regulator
MPLESLVYGFRKRYSLPVLINLYHREGLTFDQIYIISSAHSEISTSRQSISRAVTELLEKKYLKKEALQFNGKTCTSYLLTEDAKKIMKKYLGKDV